MRKKYKLILKILLVITMLSLIGCYSKKEEDTKLSLYYNKKTIKSLDEMKILIEKYKEKEGREIELIGVDDEEDIKKNIGQDKDSSIVLLDGYAFLDFVSENYLRNLTYLYKEKNTREKFNIITNVYGINNGKYYGIGFMPFSLELIYNKEMLKKLDVEVTDNNMMDLIEKLANKNIKIPAYIETEYSKEVLFSSLIANDTIIYDIIGGSITSKLSDKIYEIKDGQVIMDKAKEYYDKGILKSSNFEDRNSEVIEEFNKGDIPVLLTTTLSSEKLTEKEGIYLVNKLPIYNTVNSPVGIDIIISSSIGNAKTDDVDRFLRFLLQSDVFEELGKKKIITGNKKGDSYLTGIQSEMGEGLDASDVVNELYINIIDDEGVKRIDKEMKKIMNGEYDGKEWERIIKK